MEKKDINPIEQAKRDAKKRKSENRKILFNQVIGSFGIPVATTEHQFHPIRKWRFDYCWPDHKIALEVEGGVFTGGRHTSGAGFSEDMIKYNAAVILGWRVIRTTPTNLLKVDTINMIKQLINH